MFYAVNSAFFYASWSANAGKLSNGIPSKSSAAGKSGKGYSELSWPEPVTSMPSSWWLIVVNHCAGSMIWHGTVE
jgi:hypothetical protein